MPPKKRARPAPGERPTARCTKTEVAYDAVPLRQVVVVDSYTSYHGPLAALSDNAPMQFVVQGSGADYYDPSDMRLKLKVKLIKVGDDAIANTDDVAPINDIANTMFSQVDVVLNDTVISQSTNMYPYKAYLSNLLGNSDDIKQTQLYMEGWETDLPGKFDAADNTGHTNRKTRFLGGKEVELRVRLHTDLAFQDRLIPNHVTCRMTLYRASDAFCLMAPSASGAKPATYRLSVTDAQLEVRRVKLEPDCQLHIESKILSNTGAQLPIIHVQTNQYVIPKNVFSFQLDGMFRGQIPNSVVLGLVENAAVNGMYEKNPFNFKDFDLNYMQLTVEGVPVPSKPLQPNYAKGQYLDAYETIYRGTLMLDSGHTHGIKYPDYKDGNCLYAFDLTPDQSDGVEHVPHRRTGNVTLSLRFATQTPETLTLVVLGQMNNTITIDRSRNVLFDYTK